jgi:hypothetical protein
MPQSRKKVCAQSPRVEPDCRETHTQAIGVRICERFPDRRSLRSIAQQFAARKTPGTTWHLEWRCARRGGGFDRERSFVNRHRRQGRLCRSAGSEHFALRARTLPVGILFRFPRWIRLRPSTGHPPGHRKHAAQETQSVVPTAAPLEGRKGLPHGRCKCEHTIGTHISSNRELFVRLQLKARRCASDCLLASVLVCVFACICPSVSQPPARLLYV